MAEAHQTNVPGGGNPKTSSGGSSPFESSRSSMAKSSASLRNTMNSLVLPRYQPLTITALVAAAAGYYLYYNPKRAYHRQSQQQPSAGTGTPTPTPSPIASPGGGQIAGGKKSVHPGMETKRGTTEKR